jgi:hypothetical protein
MAASMFVSFPSLRGPLPFRMAHSKDARSERFCFFHARGTQVKEVVSCHQSLGLKAAGLERYPDFPGGE